MWTQAQAGHKTMHKPYENDHENGLCLLRVGPESVSDIYIYYLLYIKIKEKNRYHA